MMNKIKVLEVAREHAAQAYRDLSVYEVTARLEGDTWYIDYELADKNLDGGGPHYAISAESGEILSCRFEQ